MPNAKTANGKDTGSFAAGTLTFKETGKPWIALVKSDTATASGAAEDAFWGPIAAAQQADYLENGNGTGGALPVHDHQLTLLPQAPRYSGQAISPLALGFMGH